MKKAMKLLLMYFVMLFASIIIGTLIYSVYLNVLNFVAGTDIQLFNHQDIIKAFFYITYCALIIICPLVSYYRIKHSGGVSQVLVFCILTLLTWGVLIPGVYHVEKVVKNKDGNEVVEKRLSGGYFRRSGDKVYYFTRDFYTNPITFDDTTTVVVDVTEDGKVDVEKIKDNYDFDLYIESQPYRDVLVKNTFKNSDFSIPIDFRTLENAAKLNFDKGWTFYLGFCSLGLLLASLFSFALLFNWKLLNACFLIFSTSVILCINSVFYNNGFYLLQRKLSSWRLISAMKSIFDQPVLFLLNCICSLIFIVTGIIVFAVRKHYKKVSE